MKKSRFLIGILVLAVMLMGAGYAAWTQSFVVEATVDAGEMALELAAIPAVSPMDTGNYMTYSCVKNDNNTTDLNDDKIVASITNLYPGQHTIFGLSVKNTGSMGIVLDSTMFDVNNNLLVQIDGVGTQQPLDAGIDVKYYIHTVTTASPTIDPTTIADINWLSQSSFDSAMKAAILAPQAKQQYFVKISMAENTPDTFENCASKYTVNVKYKQTSDAATINAPN